MTFRQQKYILKLSGCTPLPGLPAGAHRTRPAVAIYPKCSISAAENQDLSRRFVRNKHGPPFCVSAYISTPPPWLPGAKRLCVDEQQRKNRLGGPYGPRQALDETRYINYRGGRTGQKWRLSAATGGGCSAPYGSRGRNRCRTPHRWERIKRKAEKPAFRCPPPFPTSGNGS